MRISVTFIAAALQLLTFSNALFPEPAHITNGTSVVWISPDVKTVYKPLASKRGVSRFFGRDESSDSALVDGAFKRFQSQLKTSTYCPWKFHQRGEKFEPAMGGTSVKQITVQQVAGKKGNSSDIDESYTLDLAKDGTTVIKAATAQGAMHGLSTLVQLFYKTANGKGYYCNQAPVSIKDEPTYVWRGLNVDIARNYQSPEDIKKLIDGMAFNKFNRIHIHATDSQSWPIELPSIPELAAKGAYHPSLIWSAAALKDVQQYAVERGIIPVIEIDSPGHTASFHWSHPDLILGYNKQPWGSFCNEPPCGQVSLTSSKVLDFFTKIYKDLLPRTKPFSPYFHSGGDELNANIYTLDPGIKSNDSAKIQPHLQKFVSHLHDIIHKQGLHPLVWEEMIVQWNLTLSTKDVIVQTWQAQESIAVAAKKGYKTLFGDYNYWYLDCGYGQWIDPNTTNPATPIAPPYTDYCNPQKSWREIYSYDPRVNLTQSEQKMLHGGEVHIWGELTDPVNFDAKVWPRACAAAEIMWTGPKGVKGVDEAVGRRLADVRERMVGMGFGAAVSQMTWCLQNPGSCSL